VASGIAAAATGEQVVAGQGLLGPAVAAGTT